MPCRFSTVARRSGKNKNQVLAHNDGCARQCHLPSLPHALTSHGEKREEHSPHAQTETGYGTHARTHTYARTRIHVRNARRARIHEHCL